MSTVRTFGAQGWLRRGGLPLLHILVSLAVVAAVTGFGLKVLGREDVTNIVLIYLFAIAATSLRLGPRAALAAAIASALCLDYYFLVPYGTFALASAREIVTFMGLFATAVFLSSLQERLRKQARAARQSERRTEALYALARELVDATSVETLCTRAAAHVEAAANATIVILLRDEKGFSRAFRARGAAPLNVEDLAVATWAATHLEPAGAGTRNHPTATTSYVPLVSSRGCVGVMSLRARGDEAPAVSSATRPSSLILSMARQLALALERALLTEEKQHALIDAETEQSGSGAPCSAPCRMISGRRSPSSRLHPARCSNMGTAFS